jgi:ankyrin repeat protein
MSRSLLLALALAVHGADAFLVAPPGAAARLSGRDSRVSIRCCHGANHDVVEAGQELREAARSGDPELLKLALSSSGTSIVDSQDQDGNTALMLASGSGHFEIAKILFNSFAKTDIQNKRGETALTLARKYQSDKVRCRGIPPACAATGIS